MTDPCIDSLSGRFDVEKLRVLDLFSGYTIREDGVVNSRFGRTIKPQVGKNGYVRVELWSGGKGKKYLLHRLLAQAFIPNPDGKPQVNHIDGDKTNNAVSNLEYITQDANMSDASRTGLLPRGEQCHQAILTQPVVAEIRRIYALGNASYSELARRYRVSKSCIGHVIRRKNWK